MARSQRLHPRPNTFAQTTFAIVRFSLATLRRTIHSGKTSCAFGAPPGMKTASLSYRAATPLFSVQLDFIFMTEDFTETGDRVLRDIKPTLKERSDRIVSPKLDSPSLEKRAFRNVWSAAELQAER